MHSLPLAFIFVQFALSWQMPSSAGPLDSSIWMMMQLVTLLLVIALLCTSYMQSAYYFHHDAHLTADATAGNPLEFSLFPPCDLAAYGIR